MVKIRVLGCCGRASVAGFGLGWARGALSIEGIFKRIGSVFFWFPQVCFSHNSETMASYIIDIIKAYNTTKKTGYIIRDNISSNNICCAALIKELAKLDIKFDSNRHRIRYSVTG
jgi:hypothetical protein